MVQRPNAPGYRVCPWCAQQGDRWEVLPPEETAILLSGAKIVRERGMSIIRCPECQFAVVGAKRPDVGDQGMEIAAIQAGGKSYSALALRQEGMPSLGSIDDAVAAIRRLEAEA